MYYKEYLTNCFREDLSKLNYQILDGIRRSIFGDMMFFGGMDWENIHIDLKNIKKENFEYFCLSLFTIITFDQCVYTYYEKQYNEFRKKTMYPKFGWCGMGPHNEPPKKLLNRPEKLGYIEKIKVETFINEYIELFINECKEFFEMTKLNINQNEFLIKLINDQGFIPNDSDKNTIYEEIYNKLKEKI
jgi:hypothetical protein